MEVDKTTVAKKTRVSRNDIPKNLNLLSDKEVLALYRSLLSKRKNTAKWADQNFLALVETALQICLTKQLSFKKVNHGQMMFHLNNLEKLFLISTNRAKLSNEQCDLIYCSKSSVEKIKKEYSLLINEVI